MRPIALLLTLCFALSAPAAPRRRAVTPPSAPPATVRTFVFDFAGGSALGWDAGYADYSPQMDMRVTNELRLLPSELGSRTAWFLSGWNYSDDLFLYLRRRLSGLAPDQNYLVSFDVTFASNAGAQCGGIGGAPGASVYLKMGASTDEPVPALVDDLVQLNVDKGNQAQSGVHASVSGTIGVEGEMPCSSTAPYVSLKHRHDHLYAIRTSTDGAFWLFLGIDSGFEGYNSLYVQRVEATLTPVASNDPRARWQTTYAQVFATVAELERAGVLAREIGRGEFEPLNARDIVFKVGPPGVVEELHFYVFNTPAETAQGRSAISPDGRRIGNMTLEWVAPPHFFEGDHFLVNYVGSSPAVLQILTQKFGQPFAQ